MTSLPSHHSIRKLKNSKKKKLIDDMLSEYQFMDTPIKTPPKPKRPPSETPTIDQILHTLLS
jgi:hypothetical protein